MTSILNSISSGDLQVQQVPGDIPNKEDSIIDLLLNSEIEFTNCPNPENPLDDFNTGFGENNEAYYQIPCQKPPLRVPLYKENYLSEFTTEEDKAKARKALGLFNNNNSDTKSLITAEDVNFSYKDLVNAQIKQLKLDSKLFTPVVAFKSVFDSTGVSLEVKMRDLFAKIKASEEAIDLINNPSKGKTILSLKDIQEFLQGFNNGDTLQSNLEAINKDMLRFEQMDN